MSKQNINTGSLPNDGTGDSLRTAFTKTNQNFTELYDNQSNVTTTSIAAFNTANAAYNYANTIISENTNLKPVFDVANAAFDKANTVVTDFSPAFDKANTAYNHANDAYNYANTIISENTNLKPVFDVANAAFDKANSIVVPDVSDISFIANDAFSRANDAYDLANGAYIRANQISNIADLNDVQIDYGTITAGYVLKWDGTKWSAGVDATTGGGGTDADTLEGYHGSYYLDYHNFANTPNLLVYELKSDAANAFFAGNTYSGFMANSVNTYVSETYATIASLGNYASLNDFISSFNHANAAFDKANSANVLAHDTGIGANAYAITIGAASNTWANTVGVSDRNYTNVAVAASNTWANTVGAASNNWANTLLTTASNATIGNVIVTYTLTAGKFVKLGGTEESLSSYSSVTGAYQFDCSNNYIFYVSPTGNFTANLTNFTIDSNCVTSVTLIINQGSTPYMSNNYMFTGSANLAINWQGGTPPTGTANKKDILTLSIMNINGSNTIFGQIVSFG